MLRTGCCQSQNYKIWKQFTTGHRLYLAIRLLLSITKLQNLKAIHNSSNSVLAFLLVVVNHKTTKFESNSQLSRYQLEVFYSCCQSQNYKIWKQFTTDLAHLSPRRGLLSITKLQNLKAIHNRRSSLLGKKAVVVNHKTTKFESNSQRTKILSPLPTCCCQSQNYKIWKQFTTGHRLYLAIRLLLSITKLQNLKAIHNAPQYCTSHVHVVVNHKTTKFESNSQQVGKCYQVHHGCCQSQNYKIWKQFTTKCIKHQQNLLLLSITKLQNLKAIHNNS